MCNFNFSLMTHFWVKGFFIHIAKCLSESCIDFLSSGEFGQYLSPVEMVTF